MTALRVIQFVPPAPLVWAQATEAFARFGVAVEVTTTTSSDEIGVADNAIGWGVERGADLVIAAQLERRMGLRFCASPDLRTLADAAARPIAAGIAETIALRAECGLTPTPPPEPARLVDLSFLDEAARLR